VFFPFSCFFPRGRTAGKRPGNSTRNHGRQIPFQPFRMSRAQINFPFPSPRPFGWGGPTWVQNPHFVPPERQNKGKVKQASPPSCTIQKSSRCNGQCNHRRKRPPSPPCSPPPPPNMKPQPPNQDGPNPPPTLHPNRGQTPSPKKRGRKNVKQTTCFFPQILQLRLPFRQNTPENSRQAGPLVKKFLPPLEAAKFRFPAIPQVPIFIHAFGKPPNPAAIPTPPSEIPACVLTKLYQTVCPVVFVFMSRSSPDSTFPPWHTASPGPVWWGSTTPPT